MFPLVCLVLLLILAISVVTLKRVTGTAGTAYFAVMLICRTLALAALCALIWKVFWGPEELLLETSHKSEAPEVVVLQDRSASMDVLGDQGWTRDQLAESIWEEVERKSGKSFTPGKSPLRRYFFAQNLVKDGEGRLLLRDGTGMSKAFTEILSRESLHSLLIVSDGNSTDGLAPAYFLNWARNRNVRINAICSADPGLEVIDRAIQEVLCEERNPFTVTARIRCTGKDFSPVRVQMTIDKKELLKAVRDPAKLQEVVFRLPPLDRGWHEFTVHVEPRKNEATDLNNTFHGVFRIDEQNLLFLHDRPRLENVHLVRYLKKGLEESCLILPAAKIKPDDRNIREASAVILSDVSPKKIPAEVLEKWISRGTPLMILGGESLEGWAGIGLPSFPVTAAGDILYLGEEAGPGGEVILSSLARAYEPFRDTEIHLTLDLLRGARVRGDAELVYEVKREGKVLPLLVADSLNSPRFAVLLADTTWKWALGPDRRTRLGYETFWSTCLGWMKAADSEEAPLLLSLVPGERSGKELRGIVAAASPAGGKSLQNCRVRSSPGGQAVPAESTGEPGRYSFHISLDRAQALSGVIWLQAMAKLDGKDVLSQRVPVAFNRNLRELQNVHVDPEMLRKFTTGEEDGFSWYSGREAVINSLFREAKVRSGGVKVEKRNPFWELLLAALAFLCLALEWWLERRLYAGEKD